MSEINLNEIDDKLINIIGKLQDSSRVLKLISQKCNDLIIDNTSKETKFLKK